MDSLCQTLHVMCVFLLVKCGCNSSINSIIKKKKKATAKSVNNILIINLKTTFASLYPVYLQIAHKYLVEKHLSPQDETQFKEQLYRIWFELYTRRGSSRWVNSGTTPQCNFTSGICHYDGDCFTLSNSEWLSILEMFIFSHLMKKAATKHHDLSKWDMI